LRATTLRCCGCGIELQGSFEFPALLRLDPDELAFMIEFVRVSGSLKEMARLRRQSYPTIRNRLDQVIAKLDANGADVEQRRKAILDALARGELSVDEATAKLREMSL
jgi:hypothetical protein